jgi:hypothetical protein
MSGRRAAAIALSLVIDLAERLDAAGVPPDRAPTLDEGLDAVWPLAKALARLEKTAARAGDSAARARTATLDCATAMFAAAAGTTHACGTEHSTRTGQGADGTLVRPDEHKAPGVRWGNFDPERWHVALVRGPVPERERDREVA